MQLWCSEACGRCCLRSRSSPPLPKTTVLGAAVGALGARKALTPAAHASATISRAMIAAEWARVAKCNRHQVGCVERLPPPPPCSTFQTPPFRQDRVLCAMHELSPAQRELAGVQGPARTAPAPPSLQNDSTLLPCPHLDAWSDTRGATATRQQQGEARCAGLFASAAREDRSELCKGSSDSAFITAQATKR